MSCEFFFTILQTSDEAVSDLSSLSDDSCDHQVKSFEDQLAHAVVARVSLNTGFGPPPHPTHTEFITLSPKYQINIRLKRKIRLLLKQILVHYTLPFKLQNFLELKTLQCSFIVSLILVPTCRYSMFMGCFFLIFAPLNHPYLMCTAIPCYRMKMKFVSNDICLNKKEIIDPWTFYSLHS